MEAQPGKKSYNDSNKVLRLKYYSIHSEEH